MNHSFEVRQGIFQNPPNVVVCCAAYECTFASVIVERQKVTGVVASVRRVSHIVREISGGGIVDVNLAIVYMDEATQQDAALMELARGHKCWNFRRPCKHGLVDWTDRPA